MAPLARVDPTWGAGRGDDVGGRRVERGAPLLVLEAMKMEHTIKAPRAGVVKAFRFEPGDQVSEGVELVELEP